MIYSLDYIYKLVGRDDKAAILTFYPNSISHKKYIHFTLKEMED